MVLILADEAIVSGDSIQISIIITLECLLLNLCNNHHVMVNNTTLARMIQHICSTPTYTILVFPPNHLVHNPRIGLNDLDDFGGDVFVDVVRDGRAVVAGGVHRHGGVHGLQQAAGVDACDEEARLVERLGALGRCANAYRRERMADRGEEGGFLREGSRVGDHCEGVHLQAVVVVEA